MYRKSFPTVQLEREFETELQSFVDETLRTSPGMFPKTLSFGIIAETERLLVEDPRFADCGKISIKEVAINRYQLTEG